MRDIFFDLSVRSVRLNFMRSILASIGIVIGVIAISSMGMLGTNMQLQIKDQLSAGANTIVITPDVVRMGPPGFTQSGSSTSSSSSSSVITKAQLSKIKLAAGANASAIIPVYSTNTEFTLGSVNGRGTIYGIDPDYITKFLTIENGTNIVGANDALVGSSIAENFELKLGSRVKVGSTTSGSRAEVRVVGILEERGMAADSVSTDNAIIVSEDWYTNQYGGKNEYPQINVIVKNIDTITEVETAIDTKLNANEKTPVIRIRDASSMLSSISSTLDTMTTFILAIGAISLLVAATSIFNVMMMSVNERVRK
jgi:putative ABC transport system permease protein